MAASTLQAMLIRLGFDLSGLAAGGVAAKEELTKIKASAVEAQTFMNNVTSVQAGKYGQRFMSGGSFIAKSEVDAATAALQRQAVVVASGAEQIVAAQTRIMDAADKANISMGSLGMVAGTVALFGFLDFTHKAVAGAIDFQTQMKLIQTQARANTAELNNMSNAVLRMAVGVQTGPEELAKGLYHIESVGIQGAKALEILTVAAEGARVGNADLESVTNAMVAAVTSGVGGVTSMTQAMGTLNGIVGSGNMRMQDLADSLRSGVLATATAFGVTLQGVGAALATMTDQGIPATEAATRLRITMALLGAPTKTAADQLSRIGISSRELADDMRGSGGLIAAVQDLSIHLKQSGLDAVQQAQVLKAAFGGSRSSSGLLTLINTIDLMKKKLDVINETAMNFGTTFEQQSETAAAKFAALGAAVGVLQVHFGNALLPVITAVAGAMSFLAQQTAIMVPLLVIVTAAIIRLATVALARLIAGLGFTAANMVLGRMATILMTQGFAALAASGEVAALSIHGVGSAVLVALGPLNILLIALAAIAVAYGNVKAGIDAQSAALEAQTTAFANQAKLADLEKARAGVAEQLKIAQQQEKTTVYSGSIFQGISAQPAIQRTLDQLDEAIAKIKNKMQAGLVLTNGLVIDMTTSLIDQLGGASISALTDLMGAHAGADVVRQFAKEVADSSIVAQTAFDNMAKIQQTALTPMQNIAKMEGQLASQALADGLNDRNPAVRSAAQAAKQTLEETLFALGVNVKTPAMQIFLSQLKASEAQAAASSHTLTGTVRQMNAAIRDTGASASDAAKKLISQFGTSLKAIDAIGRHAGAELAQAYADGIAANQQAPIDALKKLHTALHNQQSRHAQIAFLLAALAGQDIARGLRSADPAARAQANATVKIYEKALDDLTNGAYSAGMNAANNFIRGWALPLARGHANAQAIASLQAQLTNAWSNGGKGGLSPAELAAGTAAYDKLIKSLKDVGAAGKNASAALQAASNAMVAAWTKIHDAAMRYFDKLHAANLKAIADHKAMIQATIDHAQAGLDAVDKAEQLQQLIAAVQSATDPQAQLAALQALHKFQAQQQIDAAQKAADLQEKIATDAENNRYTKQIAAFNKALNALETYLDKHPKLWKSSQERVIKLLHSFGISYASAGELLGNSFAKGFKVALQNLEKAMAGALRIKVSWATLVLGGKGFAEGAWKLANDQYAQVHAGEMIVPASAAGPLRDWLSRAGGGGQAGAPWSLGISGAGAMSQRSNPREGGGTIIFKVGDEELARMTDRRLYIERSIRQPQELEFGGSTR